MSLQSSLLTRLTPCWPNAPNTNMSLLDASRPSSSCNWFVCICFSRFFHFSLFLFVGLFRFFCLCLPIFLSYLSLSLSFGLFFCFFCWSFALFFVFFHKILLGFFSSSFPTTLRPLHRTAPTRASRIDCWWLERLTGSLSSIPCVRITPIDSCIVEIYLPPVCDVLHAMLSLCVKA